MSHCASSCWIVKPIVSAYGSVQIVNIKHTDEENPDVSLERERESQHFSNPKGHSIQEEMPCTSL